MKEKIGLRLFLFMLLFGIWGISSAQNNKVKYGKISKEELANKVCKADTSAYAEVLYDYGDSEIIYDRDQYKITLKCFKRIKIYSKNGYHYANIEIPYNVKTDRITGLKACTYNLINGKIVPSKLTSDGILEEELVNNHRKKKITFPDIKEGSIIEIMYTRTVPLSFNYTTWYFQGDIPVRYSEFCARIPVEFNFKENLFGYEAVKRKLEEKCLGNDEFKDYNYSISNVPAFPRESFVDCRGDYITKIEFELASYHPLHGIVKNFSSDWETICSSLEIDESFGAVFNSRAFLKDIVTSLGLEGLDEDNKAKKIYEYVRDNYKWNNYYSLYSNTSLKKITQEKTANSGGMNLLLIALLREAGYECSPVILSTKSNGRIRPGAPKISDYNHTIACLQYADKKIYLDAIDKYSSFNILPTEDSGDMVLIKEKKHQAFTLENNLVSSEISMIDVKINKNGTLKGSMVYQLNNHFASLFRENFDTEEKRIERIQKGMDDFEIDSYGLENLKDNDKSISEKYNFVIGEDKEMPTVLYFPALLNNSNVSNPFKLEDRRFPVNMPFKKKEMISVSVDIPDNYVVKQLPESINVVTPDKSFSFKYNCSIVNNKISVISTVQNLKTLYLPEEYQALKAIYDILVKKSAEQIVLKLKE